MMDVEWTNDSVLRLIEEYKKRPELWDKDHDMYRVQTAKYEAWASMAKIFDCDIADLRKKFNSILASHRREKSKIRGGSRSSWFLYPYLSFVPNHLDQPPGHTLTTRVDMSQESQMETELTSDEHETDEYPHDITIKQEPAAEAFLHREAPKLKNSKRLTRTVKRKFRQIPKIPTTYPTPSNNQIDSKLLEMMKLLKKSSELSKKKDECDTFGEYIAISLRKHDERTQSMIKQAINNILFEQEMKKYSVGQQYTVVIGGGDENPLMLGDGEDAS